MISFQSQRLQDAIVLFLMMACSLGWCRQLIAQQDSEISQTHSFDELTGEGLIDESLLKSFLTLYDEQSEQLARIENRPFQLNSHAGEILLSFQSPGLVTSYEGGNDSSTRVFAVRMIVTNLTDQDIEIDSQKIILNEEGKRLVLAPLPATLRNDSISLGNTYPDLGSLEVAAELSIPAGGLGATWLVYHGLDLGQHIPSLEIEATINGETYTTDLNTYFFAALKLEVNRIGPRRCLGLLEIHGDANTLSLRRMLDELDQMTINGLARAMIVWHPDATAVTQELKNTFFQEVYTHGGEEFEDEGELELPAAIRDVAVVIMEDDGFSNLGYLNEGASRFFRYPGAAATHTLATAFELAPLPDVTAELIQGHVYSKIACLRLAGSRLSATHLPVILQYAQSEDTRLRKAAMTALGFIDHQKSRDVLLEAIHDLDHPEVSKEALKSVLLSPIAATVDLIKQVLHDSDENIRKLAMSTLALYPQPEWRDQILALSQQETGEARIQAIHALAQIGHPQLKPLLLSYLKGNDQVLAQESFSMLLNLDDDRLSKPLEEYCLSKLKEDSQLEIETIELMIQFFRSYKPEVSVEILTDLYRKQKGDRSLLISALIDLGDEQVFDWLINDYHLFQSEYERIAIMSLRSTSPLHYEKLVRLVLSTVDEKTELNWGNLMQGLDAHASPVLVEEMISFVRKWDDAQLEKNNDLRLFVNGCLSTIGRIGNSQARKFLAELILKTSHKSTRDVASRALRDSYQNSAVSSMIYNAEQHLKVNERSKALRMANVAIELEPEFAQGYAIRAECRYLDSKIEECVQECNLALSYNPALLDLYLRRSECFLFLGQNALAEGDLLLAAKLRGQRVEIQESLAMLYRRLGETEKGSPIMEKLLANRQLKNSALVSKAILVMEKSGLDEAMSTLGEQSIGDIEDPKILYRLAQFYALASRQSSTAKIGQKQEFQNKAISCLEKLDRKAHPKLLLLQDEPDLKLLIGVERFDVLREKYHVVKPTDEAVGHLDPVHPASFSASIDALRQDILPGVYEVVQEEAEIIDTPRVVTGPVLLLAPPE